jgi:hypothetical protein
MFFDRFDAPYTNLEGMNKAKASVTRWIYLDKGRNPKIGSSGEEIENVKDMR